MSYRTLCLISGPTNTPQCRRVSPCLSLWFAYSLCSTWNTTWLTLWNTTGSVSHIVTCWVQASISCNTFPNCANEVRWHSCKRCFSFGLYCLSLFWVTDNILFNLSKSTMNSQNIGTRAPSSAFLEVSIMQSIQATINLFFSFLFFKYSSTLESIFIDHIGQFCFYQL